MQAIKTRYLGPTNTHGARIRASAEAGAITIPYPYELSGEATHRKAAEMLCAKLGWTGSMASGQLPSGDYAFCFIPETP